MDEIFHYCVCPLNKLIVAFQETISSRTHRSIRTVLITQDTQDKQQEETAAAWTKNKRRMSKRANMINSGGRLQ